MMIVQPSEVYNVVFFFSLKVEKKVAYGQMLIMVA